MSADHDTAAVLTKADRHIIADAAQRIADEADTISVHDFAVVMLEAAAQIKRAALAAQPPQDDPQPDERETLGVQRLTAMLPAAATYLDPRDDSPRDTCAVCCDSECGGACQGAMEVVRQVIEALGSGDDAWDWWRDSFAEDGTPVPDAAGPRRDPDAGLRERVEVCASCDRTGPECDRMDGGCCDACRATGGCSHDAALAEPTPGSES